MTLCSHGKLEFFNLDRLKKDKISFGLNEETKQDIDISYIFDNIQSNIKISENINNFSRFLIKLFINNSLLRKNDYKESENMKMVKLQYENPPEENLNIENTVAYKSDFQKDNIIINLNKYFENLRKEYYSKNGNSIGHSATTSHDVVKENILNKAEFKSEFFQTFLFPDKIENFDKKDTAMYSLLMDDKKDYHFSPLSFIVRRPVIKKKEDTTIFHFILKLLSNENGTTYNPNNVFMSMVNYITTEYDLKEPIIKTFKTRKTYFLPLIYKLETEYTSSANIQKTDIKLNDSGVLEVLTLIHSLLDAYVELAMLRISINTCNSSIKIAKNLENLLRSQPVTDDNIANLSDTVKYTILFCYILLFDCHNPSIIQTIENTLHYIFNTNKSTTISYTFPDEHKHIKFNGYQGDDFRYRDDMPQSTKVFKHKDLLNILNAHYSISFPNSAVRLNQLVKFAIHNRDLIDMDNASAINIAIQVIVTRYLPVVKSVSLYNINFEQINDDIYYYDRIYIMSNEKRIDRGSDIDIVSYYSFIDYLQNLTQNEQDFSGDLRNRAIKLENFAKSEECMKSFKKLYDIVLKRPSGQAGANTEKDNIPDSMFHLINNRGMNSLQNRNLNLKNIEINQIPSGLVLRGASLKKFIHGVQTVSVLPVHAFILQKISDQLWNTKIKNNTGINLNYFSDYTYLTEEKYKNLIMLKQQQKIKHLKIHNYIVYIFLNLHYYPALPVFKQGQPYFSPTVYTKQNSYKLLIIATNNDMSEISHQLFFDDITFMNPDISPTKNNIKLVTKNPNLFNSLSSGTINDIKYNKIVNTTMKDFLFQDIKLIRDLHTVTKDFPDNGTLKMFMDNLKHYFKNKPKTIHTWNSEDISHDRIILYRYLDKTSFIEEECTSFFVDDKINDTTEKVHKLKQIIYNETSKNGINCVDLTRYNDSNFGLFAEFALVLFDYEGEHYSKQIVESMFMSNGIFQILEKKHGKKETHTESKEKRQAITSI